MTIGATDPLPNGAAAARSAGADVVAPPNLLAAIVEWGIGTPEADLQPDGTPNDGGHPSVIPASGCGDGRRRRDGVGQPGRRRHRARARVDARRSPPKQTRTGTCVFVTTLNTFTSADGTVLNRNRRTVVLRNPLQES